MLDFVIRGATVADVETITEFNACLAQETEDMSLDRPTLRRGVEALVSDATRGSYYLACTDRVVGQIMHTREWSDWRNGDIWWIQSVYVHPHHRRRGVFRSLYQHLRTLAESDPGVVGLRLYVERQNTPARDTYKGLGMSEARYLVMQHLFGGER